MPTSPRAIRSLSVSLCLLSSGAAVAAPPADTGACPVFHCSAEAQGAMALAVDAAPHEVFWQKSDAGTIAGQGCSGDGATLACVFDSDLSGTGTLKVFDPLTQRELWGSAAAGSIDLGRHAAIGQVPFLTADHKILLANDKLVVRYSATGTAEAQLSLRGSARANAFGITPLVAPLAVVTQSNGALTAFDTDKMRARGKLLLLSATGAAVSVTSPSSAHGNRTYVVTNEAGTGLVPSALIAVNAAGGALARAWTFPYRGRTGASPVVFMPDGESAAPAVLVHVPGRADVDVATDQLLAVTDGGTSAKVRFAIDLPHPLSVAPLVDAAHGRIFFTLFGEHVVRVIDFKGALLQTIDVAALLPSDANAADFAFDGHLVGTFPATGAPTLLLSGAGASSGQLAVGLDPDAVAVRWVTQLDPRKEAYTAAWTIQTRAGGNCPIVVGANTGINVLCPTP